MTAVVAMHPSRFGAIRSLVPFKDFRLSLRPVHAVAENDSDKPAHYRVRFQPLDDGELLNASRLAQVARVYGRSAQFDADVFDSVIHWLADEQDCRVTTSFSALSLEDDGFVDRMISITDHYGVDRTRVCLELDQAVFHPHEEDVKEGLERLRQAGFAISLNHSSGLTLELCASGLVDFITVSRRHVGSMLEDPQRYQAVVAMGQMAKAMGVGLIAEGADDYERLGALIECGVTHVMGSLFGDDRLVRVGH